MVGATLGPKSETVGRMSAFRLSVSSKNIADSVSPAPVAELAPSLLLRLLGSCY